MKKHGDKMVRDTTDGHIEDRKTDSMGTVFMLCVIKQNDFDVFK